MSVPQPPQDLQAEQSVLGAVLLSKEALADVTERLYTDDIYRPAHRLIFEAILDIYTRGDPVDVVTVAAELDRRGHLRRVGGAVYLHTLIQQVPTPASAGFYARIVAEKALLRRLTEAGTRITAYGYSGADGGADISELLGRVQDEILAVVDGQIPADEPLLDTWEPIDLTPWLSGEVTPPRPTLGIARNDGLRMIYEGREHAVLGETESGKTWWADGCTAAELLAGNHVVYLHYEEACPASTVERLRLLGVDPTVIKARLRFLAPDKPPLPRQIKALLTPAPTLVIHDGVNEAMSMMGAEIKEAEGASRFRRLLITPFRRAGAAVLVCDHLPLVHDPSRKDAFGSVHKGNALDGARIMLVNTEPFGRRMRGASKVLVTKDRPGQLRCAGSPTKHPGITYMGMLIIDDAVGGPDFLMRFYAPKDGAVEGVERNDPVVELADAIYAVVALLADQTVESTALLYAHARSAGVAAREEDIRAAANYLLVTGRFERVNGKHGARGFRALGTSAQETAE
jgi:hypothetical protein